MPSSPSLLPSVVVTLLFAVSMSACVRGDIVVVDTEAGPGDMIALSALLATAADVRLVTISGNTGASLAAGTNNVLNLLTLLGRSDVRVAAGSGDAWSNRKVAPATVGRCVTQPVPPAGPAFTAQPLPLTPTTAPAAGSTAAPWGALFNMWDLDTLYGTADDLPASATPWTPTAADATQSLISLIKTQPLNKVTYVALASLTNLADFLTAAPNDVRAKVSRVHVIAGALQVGGAASWVGGPAAASWPLTSEWNLMVDPVAADFVFTFPNLIRYVYPVDVLAPLSFTEVRFRQFTSDVLAANAAAAAASTLTPRQRRQNWIAKLLTNFRTAFTSSSSGGGSFASFFDMFGPREAFVALAATRDDMRALFDSTPATAALRVNSQGILSSRPAPSVATSSFLYAASPSSLNGFWTVLASLLIA